MRAGARGYLLKDVSLAELVARDPRRRGRRDGGAAGRLRARRARPRSRRRRDFPRLDPPDPLTEREVEVLRLMTGGYSNREIARALSVAEGTVKNHVSSILSKLGVRDRTRAVLQAVRAGYLG